MRAGFILKDNVEEIWFQKIIKFWIQIGGKWGNVISMKRERSLFSLAHQAGFHTIKAEVLISHRAGLV